MVDDNPAVANAMRIAFEVAGHRVDVAGSPGEAFSRLADHAYDAILLDLNFAVGETAGDEGLACLTRIMADDPAACVVVITAHSGIRIAVAAMQAGARDFVMKPWRNSELVAKVEAAIARGAMTAPAPHVAATTGVPAILGDCPAIAAVRGLVRRIGPTMAGVAIAGLPGTGRSLVAQALHALSGFSAHPAVAIDLRDPARWDRLAIAGATVVLRHVDRLDEVEQATLLTRLGPTLRPIVIGQDFGGLAPALRARIATIEIRLPPLEERGGDALSLARHFVRVAAQRHGLPTPRLTPAAESLVLGTHWQEQVRGLALAVERAVLLASTGEIDAAALAPAPAAAPETAGRAAPAAFDLAGNERAVIAAALREHHHNVTQAAVALGLSRGALYRRIERYGL